MAFAAAPTHADLPREDDSAPILVRWLVGLRWAVFAVLGATLPFGERFLDFHVKYALALPVLAVVGVFNAVTQRRVARGQVSPREVALGVALDLVGIGLLLAASGGAANPLSAVFFVHVALAASLLPARTTLALSTLAACLFAGLFALPETSACCAAVHPASGAFSKHLYAMLGAFVIASGLVVYFLTRVRRALEDRSAEIALLRRQRDDAERFASLGTLAAGTAHELATPLGTIAVLAGEIEAEGGAHGRSILGEIARCRDILTRLQASAATPRAPARIGAIAAVEAAIASWKRAHPAREVALDASADPAATLPLSRDEVEAALGALLDNAEHALGASRAPIHVVLAPVDSTYELRVEDAGAGVAPEIARRLGEPFLTTKEPGEGMGLGLYLVRTLLSHAGGALEVASLSPRGTRVTLRFAREPA